MHPRPARIASAKHLQHQTDYAGTHVPTHDLLRTKSGTCNNPTCSDFVMLQMPPCSATRDNEAQELRWLRDSNSRLSAMAPESTPRTAELDPSYRHPDARTHTTRDCDCLSRRNAFRHEAYCNKIKCQYKRGIKQTRLTMPGLRRLRRAADVLLSRGRSQ